MALDATDGWEELARNGDAVLSMPGITGWRFWALNPIVRAGGPPRDATLLQPVMEPRHAKIHSWEEWFDASPKASRCLDGKQHLSPDPGCSCGYRVVRDLAELVPYLRHYVPGPSEDFYPRLVLGACRGWGRVLPGVDVDDPDGSARVEHIEIVGPLLLPPAAGGFAKRMQTRYRCAVLAGRGSANGVGAFDRWLGSLTERSQYRRG